jgi:HK97 family phage major capsid protein
MLKNRKAVLEKRGDLVKRCNEIVDKADLEKRSLVDSERHEFEGISVELAAIDSELYKDDMDRIIRRNSGNHINVTREERNGLAEEPLRQNSGNEKRFSYALGQTMRQMVGLDPHIEKRAIVSAGSALIQNPNIVDEIIFSLQSRNPLVDAGVQFVNIDNNKQMPRVTAYPQANWVNEAGTVGASDPTIDGLKWELKDVAVLVKVKNNVLYDAAIDVQRLITEVAERAINDAILKAMFYGTGSNQPKGIDNFIDVLKVDMGTDGAALQNYNPFVSATRKLMDVNIGKNDVSFIYNPFVAETIAGFADTTGQPLNAPKMIEALRSFETTAVKSDYTQGATSDTTRIYAGDFSKMVVGLGGSFSITLDQRYADELTTGFIVHSRIDMKPLFENAFCIIEGITT